MNNQIFYTTNNSFFEHLSIHKIIFIYKLTLIEEYFGAANKYL